MTDDDTEAGPENGDSGESATRSRTAWIVVLAVLVLVLLGAVVFLLVRDDDSEETATTGSTTSTTAAETTTSPATESDDGSADTAPASSAPDPGDDLPPGPDCSAAALLDAASTLSTDLTVADFGCTSPSLGDLAGGWAWAELTSPTDSITVFYTAYEGQEDGGGATFGAWEMVAFEEVGVEMYCDDVMPAEACNQLPGVPRR